MENILDYTSEDTATEEQPISWETNHLQTDIVPFCLLNKSTAK